MSQKRSSFRRKLFGGFDRTDVIDYIEKLAEQRNKYQEEAQCFANESAELRSKLDSMTDQLAHRADRLVDTTNELDAARKELNDVLKDLQNAKNEIDAVKGQLELSNNELLSIREQLKESNNELVIVKGQLNDTNNELKSVKSQLDRSNNELTTKAAQYEKDIAAAQVTLEKTKADAETQRIAAINSASEVVSELRTKYDSTRLSTQTAADSLRRELDAVSDNLDVMSTAFTDAETKLKKLSADADKEN